MSGKYPSTNDNGHRRRQLVARVLAEEDRCRLCGQLVDKTLGRIPGHHTARCSRPDCPGCVWHPMSPVVDELLPRARGGSPYDRDNCVLMHRGCNSRKGAMTLEEYRSRRTGPPGRQRGAQPRATTTLVAW